MQSSLFDYHLPQERIAQEPIRPRDHSRLLVLDRETGTIEHRHFFEIGEFLKPGDLLVVNDSKVFKARLRGEVTSHESRVTNAQETLANHHPIEVFLLRPLSDRDWVVLLKPGKKAAVGSTIIFDDSVSCDVKEKHDDGTVRVTFNRSPDEIIAWSDTAGEIPVPPYVERAPASLSDYQTVYAERTGSVAAPTAGFHFTPELISSLKSKGIQFASVTLHVGLGTFRPMQSETLEEHVMHEEWFDIPEGTSRLIAETKRNGGSVIAVGTTTVRALESGGGEWEVGSGSDPTTPHSLLPTSPILPTPRPSGMTSIFIAPGYRFKIVDALITNFHLPKSTLLVLVSAFTGTVHEDADVGRKMILRAYEEAIKQEYRFYSFGDAMLIRSAGTNPITI
jgi:S-adenosylmethionine:tRNA ribosyltransferase-isomerase